MPDFFAAAGDTRSHYSTEQRVSPSREQPIFEKLYGVLSKPYLTEQLGGLDYDPRNDDLGTA